jgi:hypothetical protein
MDVASLEEVSICVKYGEMKDRKERIGVGRIGS